MLVMILEDDRDREAFLALHAAYEAKLYRVALSMVKAPHLAEEALQQAWELVIRHFSTIRGLSRDKTAAYLVTIVKNTSRDLLRKENHTEELPEHWDAPAPGGDALDAYGRLVELVRSMPEPYREVLELRFVLEWSNQEIAQKLGMNPSTVNTRIHRGRALLMERLEKEGYGNG